MEAGKSTCQVLQFGVTTHGWCAILQLQEGGRQLCPLWHAMLEEGGGVLQVGCL